jgi:diaminopimelate epimerase
MRTVTFHKMHGCGNDFVLIDNRQPGLAVEHMADWARGICRRAFSVGGDGLVFLESPPPEMAHEVDYRWHFYNADGSRASMCGNASRCAARLAVELGLAPAEHAFLSDAGVIRARLLGPDTVKVQLTSPKDMRLHIKLTAVDQDITVHFVDTGVPHVVLFDADVNALDLKALGPALRFHERFQPAGANANLVQVLDRKHLLLRTYERGVEDETHACGTGAVASVVLANALDLTAAEVDVTTSGGETLGVSLEQDGVYLSGKAVQVYVGTFQPAALGLPFGQAGSPQA